MGNLLLSRENTADGRRDSSRLQGRALHPPSRRAHSITSGGTCPRRPEPTQTNAALRGQAWRLPGRTRCACSAQLAAPFLSQPRAQTEGGAARTVPACDRRGGARPHPAPSLGSPLSEQPGPEAAVPPLTPRGDLPHSPQLGTQIPETHHVRTSRNQPRSRAGRQRGRCREPRTREPRRPPHPDSGRALQRLPPAARAPPPLPAPSRAPALTGAAPPGARA